MAATHFPSSRHASVDASKHFVRVRDAAPADRDEARRYFKREAARASERFDRATDETVRTFEAVMFSKAKAEAEARS